MRYLIKCKGNPFTKIRAKSNSNLLSELNWKLKNDPHVVGYEQTIENGIIYSYLFFEKTQIKR